MNSRFRYDTDAMSTGGILVAAAVAAAAATGAALTLWAIRRRQKGKFYQANYQAQQAQPYLQATLAAPEGPKSAVDLLEEAKKTVPAGVLDGAIDPNDSRTSDSITLAMSRTVAIMRQHPDYLPARYFRGRLLLAKGEYNDAENTMRSMVADEKVDMFSAGGGMPQRGEVHTYAMFAAAQAGRVEDVLNECEQNLSQNPGFKSTVMELSRLMRSRKQTQVSERLLEKVLARTLPMPEPIGAW